MVFIEVNVDDELLLELNNCQINDKHFLLYV